MKNLRKIFITLLIFYSAFFWICALITPFLSAVGEYNLSAKISYILSNACHQNPERSFWLWGYPVSLCARCIGVYIGTTFCCILVLFNKLNISIKVFFIIILFCLTDLILNLFNINTGNITRFCIGLIMGLLITITVNSIYKKLEKKYEN